MTNSGANSTATVVGEAKTLWVDDHKLRIRLHDSWDDHEQPRRALGQIAEYGFERKVQYGVVTTYDETQFCARCHAAATKELNKAIFWGTETGLGCIVGFEEDAKEIDNVLAMFASI